MPRRRGTVSAIVDRVMKLAAIAVDYDGTLTRNGIALARRRRGDRGGPVQGHQGHPRHRPAAGASGRRHRGRRCSTPWSRRTAPCWSFPRAAATCVWPRAASQSFADELARRGLSFVRGECVIETDAAIAAPVLDAIRALEQPHILAFNRGRLMVLPPGVAKSTGLRQALFELRASPHNTIGIGDAENDHDLLDACELGVAVGWGSPALRAIADEVIEGDGPDGRRRVPAADRGQSAAGGRPRRPAQDRPRHAAQRRAGHAGASGAAR